MSSQGMLSPADRDLAGVHFYSLLEGFRLFVFCLLVSVLVHFYEPCKSKVSKNWVKTQNWKDGGLGKSRFVSSQN